MSDCPAVTPLFLSQGAWGKFSTFQALLCVMQKLASFVPG